MAKISGKVLKTVLICFFITLGINGCKDDYTSSIPYVYVQAELNLANRIELNPVGGYFKINGGYGGIIIFRDMDENFLAYDATCTHEILPSCSVTTDGSGIATCPCCGSQFILFNANGSPTKGPATEPLKQYRVTNMGGRLSIRN
jgi:nitrite reductase/ring-hydroxylating ferredoxin subunit